MICQSVNLVWKVAVRNVGCVSAYFCGGHKNKFPLWFCSSFKSYKSFAENKLINSRDKYVCSSCLNLYKPVSANNIPVNPDCESIEIDQQEPVCNINEEEIEDLVENLENKIERLRWSKFSENLKMPMRISSYQDGVNITKEYKDMQTLKMIKQKPWLKQRNPLLLSFLNGVTYITVDNSSEKNLMRLFISLSRFITPEVFTSWHHFFPGKI